MITLTVKLWHAGLVLEPLPVGAWAFLSVTTAVFTKTLTFSQAFTAFTNDVIWLIVVSFFFAKVRHQPCTQRFTPSGNNWHLIEKPYTCYDSGHIMMQQTCLSACNRSTLSGHS